MQPVTVKIKLEVDRTELDQAIANAQALNSNPYPANFPSFWTAHFDPFTTGVEAYPVCEEVKDCEKTDAVPPPFAIGDVVYLKSEKAKRYDPERQIPMTVTNFSSEHCRCCWMDGNGQLQSEGFSNAVLVKA